MGLFSFLGRAVGKVAGGAIKLVGKGIEKVGDITNNPTVSEAGRSMQDAGDRLAGNIGRTGAYDSGEPGVKQTIDLNKEIAVYAKKIGYESDKIEEEILSNVRMTFDSLNKYVADQELSMDLNTLKREQNDCINNARNIMKNHISKRVSLDDRECLDVLKMQPGQEKEYRMNRFTDAVFIEGKKQLQNALDLSINKMYSDFWGNFDGMMRNIENTITAERNTLNKIVQNDDTATREYEKIKAESVILGTNLVECVMNS